MKISQKPRLLHRQHLSQVATKKISTVKPLKRQRNRKNRQSLQLLRKPKRRRLVSQLNKMTQLLKSTRLPIMLPTKTLQLLMLQRLMPLNKMTQLLKSTRLSMMLPAKTLQLLMLQRLMPLNKMGRSTRLPLSPLNRNQLLPKQAMLLKQN
jgi:hypothetical protein